MNKKAITIAVVILLLLLLSNSMQASNRSITFRRNKKKRTMTNDQHLATLNPEHQQDFIKFIKDIEATGYTPVITSSYRSFQQQQLDKQADPRNASPGYSEHNYGIAIDVVLYKNGKMVVSKSSPKEAWMATGVPDIAKRHYGMRWGGDIPGYYDPVHFDYFTIYSAPKLYAMAVKQFGSAQQAQGNKLDLSKY